MGVAQRSEETTVSDADGRMDRGRSLSQEQRDALWKWRWLGLRGGTPAFKACLVLLAAIAFALVAYVLTAAS
jgi:hypothetical protein